MPHPEDLPCEVNVTDAKRKNFTDPQTQNRCDSKNGAKWFRRSGNQSSHFLIGEAALLLLHSFAWHCEACKRETATGIVPGLRHTKDGRQG